MEIKYLDKNKYTNIHLKYCKLSDHNKFKDIINNYINNKYLDNKIDHEWINYIVYYDINDEIHVYFRKFFIKSFKKNDNTTLDTIEILFDDIIKCIKNESIMLPINYLWDIIINDIKLEYNYLLLKKEIDNKIQIKFRIYNNKIKFYIKYSEFFECDINNLNNLLDEIYNKYKQIELSKRKCIFINSDDKEFTCEDYFYDLQKFMYKKGYWLDITFHFNKNNFQNNCYFDSFLFYFIKYDIILSNNTYSIIKDLDFSKIKNKIIITIPSSVNNDTYFSNTYKINSKINEFVKDNKFYWGKRNSENPNNLILYWLHHLGYNINDRILYNNIITNIVKSIDLSNNKIEGANINTVSMNNIKSSNNDILNYDILNNNDLLNKNDFFKIHDFDVNKKLVIFFCRWPKIFKNINDLQLIFEGNLYLSKSNILKSLLNSLKKNYNVAIKIYPGSIKADKNNIYIFNNSKINEIVKDFNNCDFILPENNKEYKGINIFKGFTIINDNYTSELFKYTDFGIICYGSTTTSEANMYDIPMLEISSKENDWFYINTDNKLTEMEVKKLNSYKAWSNVDGNCLKDIIYGCRVYWEDIKDDLDNKLNDIINKDYKKSYKYFKNHLFTGNSYNSTQEDIGEKVLDVINETNLNKNINDVKYILCQEAITVYQNSYIDVLCKDEIITIEILKNPFVDNKFISSGVHIYVYNINSLCKLNLELDIKLNEDEDNVYLRLYTGIKWIDYKDEQITTEFKKLNITEDFNLETKSKWRLSTSSQKVGQKITIKSLKIC